VILETLTIGHFRCLENCVINLDPYVAIIGANGVEPVPVFRTVC